MLEEVKRFTFQGEPHREVAPVTPYPRINPQQQKQDGYPRQQPEQMPEQKKRARRRFTAMRELIEKLKTTTEISRVDFHTANQELLDIGLAIAETDLIPLLLQLKIPASSIDTMVQQLKLRSSNPTLVSGRDITREDNLFPAFVDELAEYLMRFDSLYIDPGKQNKLLNDEITNHGRYLLRHGRLQLDFNRPATEADLGWIKLNLIISVKVGAVEKDETGRRAIFYQRPDKSFGLYSDKSISLSI